jgi:CheY-like chemotaxis protein
MDTLYQILIVEDEPDTGSMLREYFGLQGYQVRIASWGEDAIAKCRQYPPDLIVLDIRLPDMDGYEVYARVRQLFRTRRTPVIFLTERRDREDKITGLQLGAVDYMTKPFDLEELSLRVRNALRWAEQAQRVNPVTNLPIGEGMKEQLRPLVGQDEWAALYVRLQNLESFGEVYGFVASDEALRAVAETLGEILAELGSEEDFVGHLSETDMVLVTSPTRVAALRKSVAARLPRALKPFTELHPRYVEDDEVPKPPISVGIGVLTSADLPPDQDSDLGQRLAEGEPPLEPLPLDS